MSLNLWDLALDKKKLKTKPKALASCKDGNERFPYFRTTLSRDRCTQYLKNEESIKNFGNYDSCHLLYW